VLYRVPLSQVARWPAWELDLLEHYLAREPAPEERLEVSLANFMLMYATVNGKQGAAQKKVIDFLPYLKAWPQPTDGRYNPVDMEVLQELM
jgi:hypothetical protein